MPATFGVTNLHGLAPATCHAQEASADASIEVATLRDSLGVTVVAKPKKLITRSITLSGKGTVNFGDVAAGAITKGVSFVTSAKASASPSSRAVPTRRRRPLASKSLPNSNIINDRELQLATGMIDTGERRIGSLKLRPYTMGSMQLAHRLKLTMFTRGKDDPPLELDDLEEQRQIMAFAWVSRHAAPGSTNITVRDGEISASITNAVEWSSKVNGLRARDLFSDRSFAVIALHCLTKIRDRDLRVQRHERVLLLQPRCLADRFR